MSNNIRIMHIRMLDEWNNVDNTGGLTVAYLPVPDMGICVNVAQCSYSDQFSRKIGRELAHERLHVDGPYDVLPYEHPYSETVKQWVEEQWGIDIFRDHRGRYVSTFDLVSDGEIIFTPEDGLIAA